MIRAIHRCSGPMALLGAALMAAAVAAPARKALNAADIRHQLIGHTITDGTHWRYYLKPDGKIDAYEMGNRRKGTWHLDGNQLCIAIVSGAAPDDCWEVVHEGKAMVFARDGIDAFDVKVENGGL